MTATDIADRHSEIEAAIRRALEAAAEECRRVRFNPDPTLPDAVRIGALDCLMAIRALDPAQFMEADE